MKFEIFGECLPNISDHILDFQEDFSVLILYGTAQTVFDRAVTPCKLACCEHDVSHCFLTWDSTQYHFKEQGTQRPGCQILMPSCYKS